MKQDIIEETKLRDYIKNQPDGIIAYAYRLGRQDKEVELQKYISEVIKQGIDK